MARLLRVGLTGGIGSGKSTVARLLAMLGAEVYVADDRAKALMHTDAILREGVTGLFGREAYSSENGELNRAYIASQVFGNADKLAALNAVVHPAVERDFLAWAAQRDGLVERPAYVVEEAAVLIESGGWRRMDTLVVVTAPLEVRLGRVMRRDGVSREAAMERIRAQMDEQARLGYADFVVEADERQLLIPQVEGLHEALCGRGKLIQDFLPTFADGMQNV